MRAIPSYLYRNIKALTQIVTLIPKYIDYLIEVYLVEEYDNDSEGNLDLYNIVGVNLCLVTSLGVEKHYYSIKELSESRPDAFYIKVYNKYILNIH